MIQAITSKFWTEVGGEWAVDFFNMMDSVITEQVDISLRETLAMIGPRRFPSSRLVKFKPLVLTPFDVAPPASLMDGSGVLDGSEALTGTLSAGWSLPAPAGLLGVDYISTSPTGMEVLLECGRDFTLDAKGRRIVFRQDPLRLPIRWDAGMEGRTGRLWLIGAHMDDGTAGRLSKVFAGAQVPAGRRAAELTGELHDLLTCGPTTARVNRAFSLILDSDASKVDGRVERVFREGGRNWVVAGGVLHSAPDAHASKVAEGGSVRRGDLLFDVIDILGAGSKLDASSVPMLFIGPELTGGRLRHGVALENTLREAPAARWLLASRSGGRGLVEDVTESDFEYLACRIEGNDVYLLVDNALDEYKLVRGSSGPACHGTAEDMAAFKAFVNEAEAAGNSFPWLVADGGNELAQVNPAAEVWGRALSKSCLLAFIRANPDKDAWRLLGRVVDMLPAWMCLKTVTEDAVAEVITCSTSLLESFDMFDCVDVEDAACCLTEHIKVGMT